MKFYKIFMVTLPICVAAVGVSLIAPKKSADQEASHSEGLMQLTNAGHGNTFTNAPVQYAAPLPSNSTENASSKREQVIRLSGSSDPAQKFRAYELIRRCVLARRDDLNVAERVAHGGKAPSASSSEICGDIDAGQIASRRQILDVAAKAGIHHAAAYLADEGAVGEGYSVDLDPNSAEQQAFALEMKQALDAGAANGDWWSLTTLAGATESSAKTPEDYKKAITLLDEANAAYQKETGHDLKSYKENRGRLTYFSNQTE